MAGRYRAYPEYRDSGYKWLGLVPIHWNVSPIKWRIERIDGGVWGSEPDGVLDTIVLRSTEQTSDGGWNISDPAKRKLTEVERGATLLVTGDLLITKSSGSSLHIGKTTIVSKEIEELQCCYSNFMQRVRIKNGFRAKLYWYIFNNQLARSQFDFLSNSTTGLANLNSTMIGQVIAAAPPAAEQDKIEQFLDYETAKINTLIEKQQQLIKLLTEKRQAVISHAVTKGLNPNAPMKDSGVVWLGHVPESWNVCRIKQVAKLESGHTPDKKNTTYWIDCNIPWVSLNDSSQLKETDYISDTAIYLNEKGVDNSSARILPERCVVFTRDASIGLAAITTRSMCVSQHIIAWICNETKVIPEYLLLIFYAMKEELERFTYGATLKTIGMPDVNKLTGVFPAVPEQQKIIEYVFHERKKLDVLIRKAENLVGIIQERRTTLISAAITGKIDVRNWQSPQET